MVGSRWKEIEEQSLSLVALGWSACMHIPEIIDQLPILYE